MTHPAALPDARLGEVVLRPVRGHHVFEACVDQLGTAIRLGVYPRGSLLPPERELAGLLGVSRATLREAIAALREAGLVSTRRGRSGGTVVTLRPRTPSARAAAKVTDATRADWAAALDFRRLVEPGAAWLLASRPLDTDRAAQLNAALEAVTAAGSVAEHRQADSRFHLTLAGLTGSGRIVDAVTSVQSDLHEMLSVIPVLARNIDHSHRQHRDVVAAVLDGDPGRARRVMEEHCDDTAALLHGLITWKDAL